MATGENRGKNIQHAQHREQKGGKSYSAKRKRYLLGNFVKMEILIVIVLAAFFLGRKTGLDSAAREAVANGSQNSSEVQGNNVVQGSNQQYGAGQEGASVGQIDVLDSSSLAGSTSNNGKAGSDTKELTEEERLEKLETLWDEHPELILVNKEHKLSDDYEVELKTLPDGTNRACVDVYDALVAMLKAGRKEGLSFEICSSYRSVERQEELLDEDIDELRRKGYTYLEAYEEATKDTMPPGYSEHATGLAFDIVALDYQMLDSRQKNTDENKWLREHCAEYGFILRYPDDKEEITGITYESWHFRYVGPEAAEYIMENDITLEEYLEEYLAGTMDIY